MALSPNERSVQGIFGFCIDYQEMRYRNTESRIVIPSVEKRRILMVEDEFINQEILKALLIDTYEVVSAFKGRFADHTWLL